MTVETIKLLRSEEPFDLFWLKVNQRANNFMIGGPHMPHLHKRPRRFDDKSKGDRHENPKSLYRHYYEAIDLIINCIEGRFNQPGYRMYHTLKTVPLKACISENYEDDLDTVCQYYQDDFDQELLHTQLQTFAVHFQQIQEKPVNLTTKIIIFDVKNYFFPFLQLS